MTAVEWLIDELEKWGEGRIKWPTYLWDEAIDKEHEEHGETWDAALIRFDERGKVFLRALIDFDEYWEKRNAPISEGIDQPGLPEGEI